MEYICRKLMQKDIEMVMDMNKHYREGFICYDSAVKFLQDEKNWIFAAVCEGVIIGFAYGYELNRLDHYGNMLYIHEVGVMEQYQRQGVGYKMMTELKLACKSRNICRYFLSAYQNNIGANALYKKLGGVVSEVSKGNDTDYIFFTN